MKEEKNPEQEPRGNSSDWDGGEERGWPGQQELQQSLNHRHPSFQPHRTGRQGQRGAGTPEDVSFAAVCELSARRKGREGSRGKRFGSPGAAGSRAEANPMGSHVKAEGLPGSWGQAGTCQGKGHGVWGAQGLLIFCHVEGDG